MTGTRLFHVSAAAAVDESAPKVKSWSLFPQYDYDINSDHPYPIYFMDPEGPWYPVFYNIAKNFGAVLEHWHELTGTPWWATIVVRSENQSHVALGWYGVAKSFLTA